MRNIGALISIIIHEIDKDQVNLVPNATGVVDLDNLAIIKSTSLEFTLETGFANVKEKETTNGILSTIVVECKIPRVSFDAYLDALSSKYFVLEITDGNGQAYLIGNAETPIQTIINKIIPAKTAGYNGKSFKFTSLQTHDILYLETPSSGIENPIE